MHVKDVQQFLQDNFSFEIVSQTSNFDDNYEKFAPYLSEAISKYDIDLLVETRKGEKIKFKKTKKENINDLKISQFKPDEASIDGNRIFIKYAVGAGKTRFDQKYIEKKLSVTATIRNWNTVTNLLSMYA